MKDFSQLPDVAPEYDLRDLLEAGCHFGHQKRKWHPKMAEWIYIEREGIHIFDLAKTAQQLRLAYNYLHDLGKKGKTVVFVGTKRQAKEVLLEEAESNKFLYIASRWLGGLLTNWKQVSRSLRKMLDIEAGLEGDKYAGYTKFERVQLEKTKSRLERFFAGLRELKDVPDCLFIVDPNRENIAVKEANLMGIPVVSLIDTNADPTEVSLPIPANDDGRASVKLIVGEMIKAYTEGRKARSK